MLYYYFIIRKVPIDEIIVKNSLVKPEFCDRNEHRNEKDQSILHKKGEVIAGTTDETFSSKRYRLQESEADYRAALAATERNK